MTKKTVKVHDYDISHYCFDTVTLESVKTFVDALIQKHGGNTVLHLDGDGIDMYLTVDREETDEEYAARLEQERKYAVLQEKRERSELAILLAKYGKD
jgi:predicted transposase YdaD